MDALIEAAGPRRHPLPMLTAVACAAALAPAVVTVPVRSVFAAGKDMTVSTAIVPKDAWAES